MKLITAFFLFLLVVVAGIALAVHKPLWNDENYSQLANVEQRSYGEILRGRVFEGNNCPLFYLIQKSICNAFNYHFTYVWHGEDIYDVKAQILLRMSSIMFMALTVATMFYFIVHIGGFMTGALAILVLCSSGLVWTYIAEARPYTIWIFLTLCQAILFIKRIHLNEGSRTSKLLVLVHCLLSLTSVFGAAQAIWGSILIFLRDKRVFVKDFLTLLLVPALIGIFYYLQAPKYLLRVGNFMELIYSNVSLERLVILGMCAIVIFILRNRLAKTFVEAFTYLLVFFIGLLSLAACLIAFYKAQHVAGQQGFELASRYFVYLAPISSLLVMVALMCVLRIFGKSVWKRLNICLILLGLIVVEALRTYSFLVGYYQW